MTLPPLSYEETDEAQGQVRAAVAALEERDLDAARRFLDTYQNTVETLCREIAEKAGEGRPLPPDEEASLALSRPTHKTRFQTSPKRSRFSARGVWYVFYWLLDVNRDGQPETLRVVTVRSASAPSLWQEADHAGEDDSIGQ